MFDLLICLENAEIVVCSNKVFSRTIVFSWLISRDEFSVFKKMSNADFPGFVYFTSGLLLRICPQHPESESNYVLHLSVLGDVFLHIVLIINISP